MMDKNEATPDRREVPVLTVFAGDEQWVTLRAEIRDRDGRVALRIDPESDLEVEVYDWRFLADFLERKVAPMLRKERKS